MKNMFYLVLTTDPCDYDPKSPSNSSVLNLILEEGFGLNSPLNEIKSSKKLYRTLTNLFQHVDFSTFLMAASEAKSILDLIFTEKSNRIDNLAAGPHLQI